MKVVIAYPPRCYAFMPYLAPFLLKGYLQEHIECDVTTHDLNIEYHNYLWRGEFASTAIKHFQEHGQRREALLAEMISQLGQTAWNALRQPETFNDIEKVRKYTMVLRTAVNLEIKMGEKDGYLPLLPKKLNDWASLIERWTDTPVGLYIKKRVDEGLYADADVVGFSVAYIEQLAPSLILAQLLKQSKPDLIVIMGGNAVTHYIQEISDDRSFWPYVDYAIPYEGEHDLLQLLIAKANGTAIPEENIARPNDDHIHYKGNLAARPKVEGLPDFSDLLHIYPTPDPIYPLLTSKGCYWGKCAFCTHHEGYGQGFQRLSDKGLKSSIADIISAGGRSFYFVDEAFPPRTLAQVSDTFSALDPENKLGLGWIAEARMEKSFTAQPSADSLRKSGCRLLVNGLESGDQTISDLMKKGVDLNTAKDYLKACHAAGIRTGWMFFIGFPGESAEQAENTFRFIEHNADYLDFAGIGAFIMERGSPLWNKPEEYGISEILDKDKVYPLSYEYAAQDGRIYNSREIEKERIRLMLKYKSIHPLLEGAVDRAFTMFLRADNGSKNAELPKLLRWNSAVADAPVWLDMSRHSIIVEKPQHDA